MEGRTVQPPLLQALTESFPTLTKICIIRSNILRMNLVSQHMRLWLRWGAPALGVAHCGASGFDGRWSCGDYLVHKFYKGLVNADHGWKQISLRSNKTLQGPFYQWVFSDNRRCFLNTDMSLYKKCVLILMERQTVTITIARVLNFMLTILVHGSLISFQYFKK